MSRFSLIIPILLLASAHAWDDCPFGLVNDTYPGDCARYVDTNGNGICDQSEPAPSERTSPTTTLKNPEPAKASLGERYNMTLVSTALIISYLISHLLSKSKVISLVDHRKVWNILLLASFIVAGGSGLLLAIRLNYGIAVTLPFNMLFWHVEFGIAMTVISVFHILWHWRYFTRIIKPSS